MDAKATLLIVDDDVNQCKTLKNILDKKGYNTHTASDSGKAVAFIQAQRFDLVIIDLILKGDKNGVEIFRDMKKVQPGIKALLFTGYGPEEEMKLLREAVQEGMIDEILRKPIWPDEILKAVEKHTGGKK